MRSDSTSTIWRTGPCWKISTQKKEAGNLCPPLAHSAADSAAPSCCVVYLPEVVLACGCEFAFGMLT